MSKRYSHLPEASSLIKKKKKSEMSHRRGLHSVGIQRRERLRRMEGGFIVEVEFEMGILAD